MGTVPPLGNPIKKKKNKKLPRSWPTSTRKKTQGGEKGPADGLAPGMCWGGGAASTTENPGPPEMARNLGQMGGKTYREKPKENPQKSKSHRKKKKIVFFKRWNAPRNFQETPGPPQPEKQSGPPKKKKKKKTISSKKRETRDQKKPFLLFRKKKIRLWERGKKKKNSPAPKTKKKDGPNSVAPPTRKRSGEKNRSVKAPTKGPEEP